MTDRIMMQVSGEVQPLRFSQMDSLLSSSSLAHWLGPPLELLPMQNWEGDTEMGPLPAAIGLLVFLQGEVELVARIPNRCDRAWVSRTGDAVLLSGAECPRMIAYRGAANVAALDFTPDWLSAVTGSEGSALRSTLSLGAQPALVRCVRALLSHLRKPEHADPLAVESVSLQLVSLLFLELPPMRAAHYSGGLPPTSCRRIQNYVREHLGQTITLAELSQLVGYSQRRFSTVFKRSFGVTPYKYVMNERLREASRRMRAPGHDMAAIAYELGFSSQSHFSWTFHRAFGVTPRDYLRRWTSRVVAGRST